MNKKNMESNSGFNLIDFVMKNKLTVDDLMDISVDILKSASEMGFSGFGGNCGRAAILINEEMFGGQQKIFACFNEALSKADRHIGHIVCMVEPPVELDDCYFLLDNDAEIKGIDDIEHWGMLDINDGDIIDAFKEHGVEITQEGVEMVEQVVLDRNFVMSNFNVEDMESQREILRKAVNLVLENFVNKSSNGIKKNKIKM